MRRVILKPFCRSIQQYRERGRFYHNLEKISVWQKKSSCVLLPPNKVEERGQCGYHRRDVIMPDDAAVEMEALFDAQRSASRRLPFPDWTTRRDRLRRLQRLLIDHQSGIQQAIDADFGRRPENETQLIDLFPSLGEVKSALRHGRRWMTPRRAGVSKWFLPASGEVLPQPLGVVGIIVPWNYPLFLAVGPLAGALAAGNRVLIKLSEFTPAFGTLFARLCRQYFAPDEIAVVIGDAEVAAAFSALPFDHLLFTGSTTVGRKVMAAAAANLTPVTLELGGKSPAVIAPGARLTHAVERILFGKLGNAGQTCIAPDYVLLPRAQVEQFIGIARRVARHMYPAGLADRDFCSIIDARQYARLTAYLHQGEERDARIEPLFDGPQRDDAAHRLAPQLIVDPAFDLDLMHAEIFGPLLPLVPYDTIDAAIRLIVDRPRPLALYWFDHDRRRTDAALRATHAGGVSVNDVLLHIAQDSMPFGGVGASGMGHYHGRWGFDTFSKLKPVFRQSRFNAVGLFAPPYRPLARRLLAAMKRFP
jgi:coniferyl-aldehyde dehydrogenase